jgi:hypothetical protein
VTNVTGLATGFGMKMWSGSMLALLAPCVDRAAAVAVKGPLGALEEGSHEPTSEAASPADAP